MDTENNINKSKYTIGMRTFKTGLAIFFCLLLGLFLGVSGASIAAVSAIICMRETQIDTIKTGSSRIIGTIIGGLMAYIYLFLQYVIPLKVPKITLALDWLPYLMIPIFAMISIQLCNILKIKEASTITSIVFIVVTLGYGDDSHRALVTHVILRVVATLIGIVIAMLINRFIAPYDKNEA